MADLPPGPGLDAAMAERVMRWHYLAEDEWVASAPKPCFFISPHSGKVIVYRGGGYDPEAEWSPSTDWRAAGEVWAKLREIDCVEMQACYAPHGTAVFVYLGEGENRRMMGHGDSEEHAICLAALAAVEEKT